MGNKKIAPFVGMVMAMVLQSGSMVVIKAAMNDDFNKYVLIVYSLALSTLLLLPFLFLLPRSSGQIFAYVGIDLSSPTLASAMLNLIPALTFVLALLFRMEKVEWGHFSTQAKVLGTVVSTGGAFVVILYKGPPIFKAPISSVSSIPLSFSPHFNWILGGFFCVADSLVASVWYIYQASVIRNYPAVMVTVFFQLLFSTIQCSIFALIAVRDQSAWQLNLDTGLIAIFYQAIAATTLRYLLCTWSVQKAGPFFCSMFKPISIIFTVIMGALFLGDDFYLGSLIGAVIIVVGFYGVMWGKATEEKCMIIDEERLQSTCQNAPLLHDKHLTI
ncbi:WAT1-related protein At3g28050 isoform X2 [Arachis hypogaea]|uniref:WAT1-related protein At3g28050 isoform X2 n=1 Tax=Arachis hypogaea TaxID=3818 RepID=UPI003B221D8B